MRFDSKAIDQTIQKNLSKLGKPGVLSVRPGFEITGDQLTGKQAIVATVHTKQNKSVLSRGDLLPTKIGKYNVDVREASPYQRLRAYDPAAAKVAETYGRPEERDPEWPFEREMPSGKPIGATSSNTSKALKRSETTQPAAHKALAAFQKKQEVEGGYAPPTSCPALERISLTGATITTHVSPDAGFKTLSSFLAGTKKSLKVGMYDFTSGPILQNFLSALGGSKELQMVLDNPAPNPTRNQTDWTTVQELKSTLKTRAKIARALVRTDKFASEWLFPSAYHIKVIVRDGDTFWLSSGNLNNSNQPDLSSPPTTEDRDWHVIVQDEKLASLFSAYLDYDFTEATKRQAPNPDEIEQAILNAQAKKGENSNPPPVKPAPPLKNPVAAETFPNIDVDITPLLTPDELPGKKPQYLTNIMELINKAEKSICIQLQYIESSKGDGSLYEKLLEALKQKIEAGKTVQLIESKQYGLKWAEKMKAEGVDLTDNISLQPNVHNKGFVIDSKTVVVSSQNFSPQGVQFNRDAGLIIENAGIARYFGTVFASDWEEAKPAASVPAATAPIRKKGRPSPRNSASRATRSKRTTRAKRAKTKAPSKPGRGAGTNSAKKK